MILGKKTNIKKTRKLAVVILTIAIISGYLAPMEGVFAAESKYWVTEYYMEVDGGTLIGEEEGIQYLDVEKGETVNFHMLLMEKNNNESGRFKETFSITMPEELYDQAAEAFKDGWLESDDIKCGYLLEVVNTDTATNSNASHSNATSSNSSADKNEQAEAGMQKLTFRFVEELRNENNSKSISVEEAEGMMSFTAPVNGRITITQDGNDCLIEVQPLIKMRRDISYDIEAGSINIILQANDYILEFGSQEVPLNYSDPCIITGNSDVYCVKVTTGEGYNRDKAVQIILKGVDISNVSQSPFQILGSSKMELTLSGENKLECSYNGGNEGIYAGLYVSPLAEIAIKAEADDTIDSLTTTGGVNSAGIGGYGKAGGNIIILDGKITANGGSGGAGIGGGNNGSGGNITISGGDITANGGTAGAGIGGGLRGSSGNITISGGNVTAKGNLGAGIGGGYIGDGGNITIRGGKVTANGGRGGSGIGLSIGGSGGSITISGGDVTANGSHTGVGIGGGDSLLKGAIIEISGGKITATKGSSALNDIESEYGGTIEITGGNVNPTSGGVYPLPTHDGSEVVYLNILTAGNITNANSDITDVNISALGYDYGFNDVSTDSEGKVYFWLPQTDTEETVSVTANGNNYAHSWVRKENKEIETLILQTKPNIVTTFLPEGKVGESYFFRLKAIGNESINWSKTIGNLPSGLTLNEDGEISGIPEQKGTKAFTVMAENDFGNDSADFSISIIDKPSAPDNLTAIAGDRQVKLNWTKPNDDGGSAITKYQYSVSTDADKEDWKDIQDSNANTTNYTVTGLENGTKYTLKIRAVNVAGNGEEAVLTVTPQKTASAPAAPGNLTTVSGIHQIELNWTTPDSGGSAIIKYQYSTGGDNWQDIPDSDASTTSYIVSSLNNGTEYTFKIRAVNAMGNGAAATVTVRTTSGSSDSGSSSSSSSDSTGQWKLDEKGWWYRYDNGTWPADRWVYLYYNGFYAWYHFDTYGYMQTSWFTDTDGYRYYLNPESDGTKGTMKTGWVSIDGKWYYFNDKVIGTKGALLTSATTPDGYLVDENGVWNQM